MLLPRARRMQQAGRKTHLGGVQALVCGRHLTLQLLQVPAQSDNAYAVPGVL